MTIVVCVLLAYLLGSVSFAVVSSWIFKLPDPRTYGSGNPGATNVLRSGKKIAAVLTLLGDAGKGWLAVALAQYYAPLLGFGDEGIAIVALAVFLGHVFPIFLRFQGGKGVATAVGVLLGLNVWIGLMAIATWLIVALIWRISSLSALVAAILAPIYTVAIVGAGESAGVVLLMSLVLIWRHQSNIMNLWAGKEGVIGEKKSSSDS
ncbi:glycerol-3-phosphate 1-O-acyltransferase PlsY [Nitrosomonas sp. JL21]|uniref:glycerol-3-phosphate 1-O-acyltransferase PlsY n=1 Tax=Nitrosomonas sp. JL21 TaxID=153949 RepID=UPI001370734C|nr:glycerol-3-phosphate 1-O-acyltransferase PlsY [Nitrosomonas sp. JL21]MBL8497461.1 glycerol-3-phosphate 1-O-acyltransferase PlsY [Nitrosomonas sp.]MCC7091550.1 glycerol-3-phosphate 1-O-acyltransferase PlsY [Nitrosomonas sp.]MXS78658.1 glycerol-3-phosphate 1-O-acyltransferase PlsY [Nitrosomonas sp. JL21]